MNVKESLRIVEKADFILSIKRVPYDRKLHKIKIRHIRELKQ